MSRGILWVLMAAVVGVTTQRVVAEVSARSAIQAELASVSRALANDSASFERLCEAARTITGASAAALIERDAEGMLTPTASTGSFPSFQISPDDECVAALAWRTGERVFVSDARELPTIKKDTQSALFEPLKRNGTVVAVLATCWHRRVRRLSPRAGEAIDLLAAESAAALHRAQLLKRLEQLALSDALTGAHNRRAWEERLESDLARSARDGEPVSVVILDLDHFKQFNDRHGHPAGDRLLKAAVARWRETLRRGDLLARYGGEEFAVLLPGAVEHDAVMLAERLRKDVPGSTTCSVGVACWDGEETADELIERADRALYEAKDAGRDRTVLATAGAVAPNPAPGPMA